MAEENPGKPQLGDRLMKAVRPVIASNVVPYPQMRTVDSHCTSEGETEGKNLRVYSRRYGKSKTKQTKTNFPCDLYLKPALFPLSQMNDAIKYLLIH